MSISLLLFSISIIPVNWTGSIANPVSSKNTNPPSTSGAGLEAVVSVVGNEVGVGVIVIVGWGVGVGVICWLAQLFYLDLLF